jgi:hypothetical protein
VELYFYTHNPPVATPFSKHFVVAGLASYIFSERVFSIVGTLQLIKIHKIIVKRWILPNFLI